MASSREQSIVKTTIAKGWALADLQVPQKYLFIVGHLWPLTRQLVDIIIRAYYMDTKDA